MCILTAHHSVADGISPTYLVLDLLQPLAGHSLAPLEMSPSHEQRLDLPADVLPALAESATTKPLPGHRTWDGTPPRLNQLRLSETLSGKLRARRERITAHGALTAVLVLARGQVLKTPS